MELYWWIETDGGEQELIVEAGDAHLTNVPLRVDIAGWLSNYCLDMSMISIFMLSIYVLADAR